jgi:hypothetical protein
MNVRFAASRRPVGGSHGLIPNLNRSGVDLPVEATAVDMRQQVRLDKDLPVRRLSDRQIYPLFIEPGDDEADANQRLVLNIVFNPQMFTVLDQSGRPLPLAGGKVTIDLKAAVRTKIGGVQIYLEAISVPGSPRVDESLSEIVQFELVGDGGEGLQTLAVVDGGVIRPAHLVLVGDHAPPECLLMCTLDENTPSVLEVRDAARQAGVPVTLVPKDLGAGDSWLQDQFQVAYALGGREQMQVVVHLPRMVNDGALFPTTPNLKNFVERYFPSQSIALFNDFWEQKIVLNDGTGPTAELSVAQSYLLYKELDLVPRMLRYMFRLVTEIDSRQKTAVEGFRFDSLYDVRLAIDSSYRQLNAYSGVKEEQRAAISKLKGAVERLSSLSSGNISGLATTRNGVVLTVMVEEEPQKFAPKTFIYQREHAQKLDDLFGKLAAIHGSVNYGGNLEVSPPMSGLAHGKIVTGTVSSSELNAFLAAREPLQPRVEAYTGWLKVGHIDELMCFVGDTTSADGFSICRTSPKLGVALLEQVQAAQAQGRLVTRLLRGKRWLHEGAADERYSKGPPSAYVKYIKNQDQRYDLSGFTRRIPRDSPTTYFDSAYQDDRRFMVYGGARDIEAHYAAFIGCADLLHQVKVTNRAAEDFFLTGKLNFADDVYYAAYANSNHYKKEVVPKILDKVLGDAFKGAAVHRLPVLFDWVGSFALSRTSAITPNMVNLQTLNEHVLVPHPYGPRMRPDEAVLVLRDFLERGDERRLAAYARTTLNARWIHACGLDVTNHWARAGAKVAVAHAGRRPSPLDQDYKEMWRALYRSIESATGLFDIPSYFEIMHRDDPYLNHPVLIDEDLACIANWFKDGFEEFKNHPVDYCQGDDEDMHPGQDYYDEHIAAVMEKIGKANPGAFDDEGQLVGKDWMRIVIPENTVDIFQLYAHLVLTMLGSRVHWVDSWYYHVHDGGIHCGTNVLRSN